MTVRHSQTCQTRVTVATRAARSASPTPQRWEDGGGYDERGRPNEIPEPTLFTPLPCTAHPGPSKVEVLALRHRLRMSLWHSSDATMTKPVDWLKSLVDLGHALREAALAERGIRWTVEGVKLVAGEKKGDPPHWRAQIWDPGANGGRGTNIHLGYADDRGGAIDIIVDWYRRYCGIDARVEPPEWFRELLTDALAQQAEASERAGGLAWDVED